MDTMKINARLVEIFQVYWHDYLRKTQREFCQLNSLKFIKKYDIKLWSCSLLSINCKALSLGTLSTLVTCDSVMTVAC